MELDHSSRHCGQIKRSWSIISSSNIMFLQLKSSNGDTSTGFQAVWKPTTDPATFQNKIGFGCENCIFPFRFEGRSYNSCTNADGNDRAWCLDGILPPVDEGTHVSLAPSTKIFCSDRDPSCPRTAQMITHPNNDHVRISRF